MPYRISWEKLKAFLKAKGVEIPTPPVSPPKLSLMEIDVDKNWAGRRIENLGVPTAVGHALRKGTPITIVELPNLTSGKIWKGDATNRPVESDPPITEKSLVGDAKALSESVSRAETVVITNV